uniref:Delta(14)-sterol reductase n=1 Tax=Aegilops tauschii TaxID=37682 RepID=M8BV54_AEGTA
MATHWRNPFRRTLMRRFHDNKSLLAGISDLGVLQEFVDEAPGLLSLLLLLGLSALGVYMGWMTPTVVADRGLELLSTTFIFSVIMEQIITSSGLTHVMMFHFRWFGVQLNPHFMGVDLKFFFIRAGMMAWLFINLSLLAKSYLAGSVNRAVILYQFFCGWYIIDYFIHEEFMTSTWDIIAERLGFMLVFGDLVFIPFTFTIQGWWLLGNKMELPLLASVANCIIFLIGYSFLCPSQTLDWITYLVFRGANKQKHLFKKDPKAPIWGKPPKVVGGKLLVSGYCVNKIEPAYTFFSSQRMKKNAREAHVGKYSVIPYFYPTYLLILLIWRERRDEARCSEKYKDIWAEYCKLVPWRILPYVY